MTVPSHPPSPPVGQLIQLEPGVRRIIAPNPSAMTYWGTNTFVIGEGEVAVIDPGPDDIHHLKALLAGLAPHERITEILVTHAHIDHSPLALRLSKEVCAPVIAFSDAHGGRSQIMQDLVAQGLQSGGEGIDLDFAPDITVQDGEIFQAAGLKIAAIWTPGHLSNHLSFAMQDIVFTGDHIMSWASSLISPPHGDLTAFMTSCDKLYARNDRIYYPAHGSEITNPRARLEWLIAHRKSREADILNVLSGEEPMSIQTITRKIYTDTPSTLQAAAQRNVLAHLIDLTARKITKAEPKIAANAKFRKNV